MIIWLSKSRGWPVSRLQNSFPEGCLSLQLTAIYIFSSSQHLIAKVQEGLITNRERIGQISVFTTFICVAAEPQEREQSQEPPKSSQRSVQIPLGREKKQHQNVPKSNALGSDGLWNPRAPGCEHLLTPDSLQRHNPDSRRGHGQGGSLLQPSRGRRCRGDCTTSVPCQIFSVPCASSSCVFYPSFCWHTWSRTIASLPGVQL